MSEGLIIGNIDRRDLRESIEGAKFMIYGENK